MNLDLLKRLQARTGTLPTGVPATRAVTELQGDELKIAGGGACRTTVINGRISTICTG